MSIASWLGLGRMASRPCPESPAGWLSEVEDLSKRYLAQCPIETAIRARGSLRTPAYVAQVIELAQPEACRFIEVWDGAERPPAVRWVAWYLGAQVELGYLAPFVALDLMVAWVRSHGGVPIDPGWQEDDASTERMLASIS